MKIIVFGTGMVGKKLLSYPLQEDVQISLICDNNKKLWGTSILEYEIHSPEEIKGCDYDKVILAVINGWMDVRDQLIDLGVKREKIILAVGWSRVDYYPDTLDEYFVIEKKNFIPFEKKPVYSLGHCGGETRKAHNRREKEGFFDKYCQGEGLDIGCGNDVIKDGCSGWDIVNGDAQYLKGVPDGCFDYVYSSHCIEHVDDVRVALKNWFRVVKKGGYLLLYLPERDLYEKQSQLPSRWNPHHKHMFLLGGDTDQKDTLDIIEEIKNSLTGYKIKYAKICDEGHTITNPLLPSDGEYSIEVVVQKI